jgi:hypothetical protein
LPRLTRASPYALRLATQASLEGLPKLTEDQIDDFYTNLMASGTTLGNLPEVASPTFKAKKPLPTAAFATEEEFAALSPEDKAQVADERLRLLGALAGQERRRKALFGAIGVPAEALDLEVAQETVDERVRSLAAPESDSSIDELTEEQTLEMVGVQTSATSSAAATLEVDEDGDLTRSHASSAAVASSSSAHDGPTWTSSSRIRSSLPPRDAPSHGSSSQQSPTASIEHARPSSTSAVATGEIADGIPSAAALLRTIVDPPKPYHDPRLTKLARQRVRRPGDTLKPASALAQAVPAPSASLTLLDTAKNTINIALAASDSAGEASATDLGLLTHREWEGLVRSFLTTEIAVADGQQMPDYVRRQYDRLAGNQARRKFALETRSRTTLPLSKLESERLVLLRERGDLALEALETAWAAGAKFDEAQKMLADIGAFLVEGGHVEGVDRLLAHAETKRASPSTWSESSRVSCLHAAFLRPSSSLIGSFRLSQYTRSRRRPCTACV